MPLPAKLHAGSKNRDQECEWNQRKIWVLLLMLSIMAARFCKDLQTICNLCKFSRSPSLWLQCCHVCMASTAKSGQEHAIALSSTKTRWVKTSGPICSVCTAQLASTIKTTKAMRAMAHPCGIEVLTLSGEHATCLPNCIHRCWSDYVHRKWRTHCGCMPACERCPSASSGIIRSKHFAWSSEMRIPPL